jgi:hypothetical protein
MEGQIARAFSVKVSWFTTTYAADGWSAIKQSDDWGKLWMRVCLCRRWTVCRQTVDSQSTGRLESRSSVLTWIIAIQMSRASEWMMMSPVVCLKQPMSIDTYIYSYIYSRELLMFVKSISHIPSKPGLPPWIQLLFLCTFPCVTNRELEELLQQPMSRFWFHCWQVASSFCFHFCQAIYINSNQAFDVGSNLCDWKSISYDEMANCSQNPNA